MNRCNSSKTCCLVLLIGCSYQARVKSFIRESLIGLAVSIVILNLGAAMGLLSGRGAWIGMLSAGIITTISAILSGTKIQNSSPTAPMAAAMAVIYAFATKDLPRLHADINPAHFINATILLSAIFLMVGAVFRLGKYVTLVPNIVVSGFMSGIAVLIWKLEFTKIFGWLSDGIENIIIILLTLMCSFLLPKLLEKLFPEHGSIVPGTLMALLLITLGVHLLDIDVVLLSTENSIREKVLSTNWLQQQWLFPMSSETILTALPFAAELSILCALDTLITALIIARMTGGAIHHRRDLGAQSIAGMATAVIGGVPGAQSTAPSILLLKEEAKTRWAAISAGIFALILAILTAPWLNYIPMAVFSGILIKVGYNIFDSQPFKDNWKDQNQRITLLFLIGTILVTAFVSIIIAVLLFTALYHMHNRIRTRQPIPDIV